MAHCSGVFVIPDASGFIMDFFNVRDSAIPPRQGTHGTARHWNLAGRGVNSFGASGFKIHSGENRYSGTGNQGQLPGFTGAMIPPRFTQPA